MTTRRRVFYAVTREGFHVAYAVLGEGSQFRFEDRGTQHLRGVPGPWQVFEVVD